MRQNRLKAARKHLSYLQLNLSLPTNHPSTVIMDGPYINLGVNTGVPMKERLEGLIGPIKAVVTRETVEELKGLGEDFSRAVRWALDECEILEGSDTPDVEGLGEAGRSVLGAMRKMRHAFVATVDKKLAEVVRGEGNGSLVRLNRTVTVLEGLTRGVKKRVEEGERMKGGVSDGVREVTRGMREKERERRDAEMREEARKAGVERKRKKAKAPNPLSIKKKVKVESREKKTKKVRRKKGKGNDNA